MLSKVPDRSGMPRVVLVSPASRDPILERRTHSDLAFWTVHKVMCYLQNQVQINTSCLYNMISGYTSSMSLDLEEFWRDCLWCSRLLSKVGG